MIDAELITDDDRQYGICMTPQALIERVLLAFNHSDRSHAAIAKQLRITRGTVCKIIDGSWGQPAWYFTSSTPSQSRGAYKDPDQVASSIMNIRCTAADKDNWVALARREGQLLAAWVTLRLNA